MNLKNVIDWWKKASLEEKTSFMVGIKDGERTIRKSSNTWILHLGCDIDPEQKMNLQEKRASVLPVLAQRYKRQDGVVSVHSICANATDNKFLGFVIVSDLKNTTNKARRKRSVRSYPHIIYTVSRYEFTKIRTLDNWPKDWEIGIKL